MITQRQKLHVSAKFYRDLENYLVSGFVVAYKMIWTEDKIDKLKN